ncbi:MAG: hypothetical protein ACRDHM_06850 [Actinomycetota bacterium]
MRRRTIVGLVGVALSLALSSDALAAPNASVDDRVKHDEAMYVEARNCVSGSNYTAYVDIYITSADGSVYSEYTDQGTDADPATPEGFNITMRDIGTYTVRVVCRHQFSGGGSGTWYDETEDVVVTGLTDDERKKCRKKATRRARKRCLRRETAD